MIASRRPEEPKDVVLTIDQDFQVQVDAALGDVTGSAVVIDPRTGAVLALVSHPAYDPNWFVSGMSVSALITAPTHQCRSPRLFPPIGTVHCIETVLPPAGTFTVCVPISVELSPGKSTEISGSL